MLHRTRTQGNTAVSQSIYPLALTFCGIGLACLSVVSRYASYGNWAAALFEGVVQGVLCAGMSVYLNEVIAHCSSNKGNDPPK
ncbi:hypothetical protein DXA92_06030 [Agathobaculum butyriciproducens]|uniref:phage holin family protein n=1 Tax=Butyricicoccus sp. OF10-2 TaxID=2292298 RepID=UPI000E415192|nr:hypothetical protein DXA92_06030 [Agathobaculum butyriciproducens]RHV84413.1 hypothetical protein DXB00_03950 [Butyricicoccus sp. OF10-2]